MSIHEQLKIGVQRSRNNGPFQKNEMQGIARLNFFPSCQTRGAADICLYHNFFVVVYEGLVTRGNGDLLKTMAGRFDVVEICEAGREQTETGNNNVKVPVNAGKSVGRDHANDKIEDLHRNMSN